MPASLRRPDAGLYVRCVRTLHLVRVLTPRELRVRYRQSVLNALWAIITPVAVMLIYGVVLTQSFHVTSSCGSYLASAWAGLVIWTFFSTALGTAAGSLVYSADLISKLYFPREALPLAAVGAALVEFSVGAVSLLVLSYQQGGRVTLVAFTSLLPVLVIVLWTSAISIMVAALAAFTRDIVHFVSLALRVGFFASAVMYEESSLPSQLTWSAGVNPITVSATAVRQTLLCGVFPSFSLLGLHLVLASAALVGAVLYVRSVESRIVDVI